MPHLAPVKVAVIPLKKNNNDIVQLAKKVKDELQKLGLGRIIFENTGNIGKSYRKHDEIGTPLCITVDFDTLDDNSVTIRDRDSMSQKRLKISDLDNYLLELVKK
jgi:glycyl-tRNA synthetase